MSPKKKATVTIRRRANGSREFTSRDGDTYRMTDRELQAILPAEDGLREVIDHRLSRTAVREGFAALAKLRRMDDEKITEVGTEGYSFGQDNGDNEFHIGCRDFTSAEWEVLRAWAERPRARGRRR